MKEIRIIPKGAEITQAEIENLREQGIIVIPMSPSWLSAFTAMVIAKEVDRTATQTVAVTRLTDAFAAVSARKIAKSKFDIRFDVEPNSAIPKGIPHEIKLQVDSWRFKSERLKQLYPSDLKGIEVVSPACYDERLKDLPSVPEGAEKIALWIGPLDANTERLKKAIKTIGDSDAEMTLRILGTGKARFVMDAVRVGRACKHPQRIVWLGEEYDLRREITGATHIVQSGLDPIAIELAVTKERKLIEL